MAILGRSLILLFLCLSSIFGQAPARAILVDGSGAWRDGRWDLAAAEFRSLLGDAEYTVATISPAELRTAPEPDILLAVPSLEQLPSDAQLAVVAHLAGGGSLMASGGEPFRDPLYLTPDGRWLDAEAYQTAIGSRPPLIEAPVGIETLSKWKQYTSASGVRFPIARGRGLSATPDPQGRYRVIGDLLSPAATLFLNTDSYSRSLLVWLPRPRLFGPQRAQLVASLRGARHRLYLWSAGPEQIVYLPGESVKGRANIISSGVASSDAVLHWSVTGASGEAVRPSVQLPLGGNQTRAVPLDIGVLPNGDYTITTRLTIGDEEVDRVDSPVRVLDRTLTRDPEQKIRVVNGAFHAGGRRVFLQGVNYWPRYIAGLEPWRVNGQSWLGPANYDPDLIEADLSLMESLHFNLVNIKYGDLQPTRAQQPRALMDFLERCRNHGIWVNLAIPATLYNQPYTGLLNPALGSLLDAAKLPGNDRVFAYDVLWEPFIGSHHAGGQGGMVNGVWKYNLGRLLLDSDWRAWVNEQYGSLAAAEQIWGVAAPRDEGGLATSPLDDQITGDGPWRIMVAAYRRFLEDYLGRNLGVIAREIRRIDPDTLLTYRNWTTMTSNHNFNTGYDIGTGAAHLDFASPEQYAPLLGWPGNRGFGLVSAYSRYRTGGQPVHWAEFGYNIGIQNPSPAERAAQASVCETVMRQVQDDGSSAASVWWWPGGYSPVDGTDFGIIDPDATPRECALVLAQWATTFAAAPPDAGSGAPLRLTVDRDADARGGYGLFLNTEESYVRARQAGRPVVLVDQGTGTDTSTMPVVQAGNAAYSGVGPLKFAKAEFGGIRIVCPTIDVTVENGATLPIPAGAACRVTATLLNTGEAQWLPASAAKGGVTLHTSVGDVPLTASTPRLQRIAMGPLGITMGQSPLTLTGRLRIQGVGDFGEPLRLNLVLDSTLTGACAISLDTTSAIDAPPEGASGTIGIATAPGCPWNASSPQPWVAAAPASGTGSGKVEYTIRPNTGPSRGTTIEIAGHPFTVTQAAAVNPALAPAPAVSARSLNFDDRSVGSTSAPQTITLTNSGRSALNLAPIVIGGANSADFSQTNHCGSAVAAAGSCTIRITFTPALAGTRTASLFIAGNISGGPVAVALSGAGTAGGPAPVIQAVVDSWGYSAGIAPGLWVTIGGTNLAGAAQSWNLSGVEQLPASLGGVTVTFNGRPAPLLYISATQINALVPASVAPGFTEVVVNTNGLASAPFTILAASTQPAVYAPPNADGSAFFITAALQGTAVLVGNRETDPRVVRAVLPGDFVDLYMIGLGATADSSKFVTDKVFAGAFPVSAPVTAAVGGKAAPVLFAGLTSPGLYLVRISIPSDLAAGPQPVQVSSGGAETRAGLLLTIGTGAASR